MKTRMIIIGIFLSLATIVFSARLVHIQLVSNEVYYVDRTQEQRYGEAKYGRVFDRNGAPLWDRLQKERGNWKDVYYHRHLEGLSAILKGVVNSKITELRGQNAVIRSTFKPRRDVPIDEDEVIPLVDGKDIYLSIDLRIQEIVENVVREYVPKFGAAGASVLVMDPHTGQVLALTSFNPENKKYEDVLHSYEPGSIFKPITAIIALENGVNPNKLIDTEDGKWQVVKTSNEKIIKDTHARKTCNMQEAMVYSSNIAFGKYVTEDIGYEKFYYGVKKFAINETYSEFPLRVSHKGFSRVPDLRTQAAQGFGQSIDATSLDVAKAFSSIANGGILYTPKLLLKYGMDSASTERDSVRRVISSTENTRLLRDMLKGVVNSGGTAENVKSKYAFFEFAGKTGTAQIRDSSGKYAVENYNSSFIGMEKVTDPHYVCLVTMYHTRKAGATVAGPVFQKIMEQIYLHPSLSPASFAREYAPSDSLCSDISFINYAKTAAESKANGMRCNIRFDEGNKGGPVVVAQKIKEDHTGKYLELSLREHQINTGLMPDVRGLALRDARGMLAHMKVIHDGTGKVYEQYPEPGSSAPKKSTVHIKLREDI